PARSCTGVSRARNEGRISWPPSAAHAALRALRSLCLRPRCQPGSGGVSQRSQARFELLLHKGYNSEPHPSRRGQLCCATLGTSGRASLASSGARSSSSQGTKAAPSCRIFGEGFLERERISCRKDIGKIQELPSVSQSRNVSAE